LNVEIEALRPAQRIASGDLRQAGNPGTNTMTTSVMFRVQRKVLDEQRPRPNEAHVAAKHVEQLGQLVQRRSPQPSPECGETQLVGEQVARGVSRVGHRSKFDEVECPVVEPGASLPEEDWRAKTDPDRDAHEQQQRDPQRAAEHHERQVEQSLSGVRWHQ
jgi:hypothetical protein